MSRLAVLFRGGLFAVTFGLLCSNAQAQIAFGVDSTGLLFRFNINTPAVVTPIGSVGFVPEGIDFRPGTSSLYALEVGPNTTQLYTIDITTAQATAVGSGFNSTGANYNLLQNTTFGFDFNPKTLQADNSMLIRVVGTNGTNLRLDSSTGQIAGVDSTLQFANGNSAFVDAAAYINNIPQAGGTTALYDIDSRNDALLLQNPPNTGTLSTVGPLGVTVDANRNIHFDIYTTPGDADLGLAATQLTLFSLVPMPHQRPPGRVPALRRQSRDRADHQRRAGGPGRCSLQLRWRLRDRACSRAGKRCLHVGGGAWRRLPSCSLASKAVVKL